MKNAQKDYRSTKSNKILRRTLKVLKFNELLLRADKQVDKKGQNGRELFQYCLSST